MKRVEDIDYRLVPMTDDFICAGTLLGFKGGRIVRRILCMDGDEVILRGCSGLSDVFEAVPAGSLADDWYRLEPLEED
ncbi:MAG: hypothetical protein ACI36W_00900 [Coriobacteriales bacterium]